VIDDDGDEERVVGWWCGGFDGSEMLVMVMVNYGLWILFTHT
jgi:hypothetical protein